MDKKDLNEVEDIDVEENIEDEDIEDNDEELDEGETFTYKIDDNNHSSSSDDSLKSIIYISVGVILLVTIIVVLIIFVNKGNSKTHEYSDIESRMTSGASKYYAKHSDLLPVNEGNSISIDASTLIENSYLKPFSEMVKEGVSCSGSVSVTKTGNEYVYFPYLDCGSSYKSELLSSKIIENSTVTGGDGLYNYNDYYVFRGEYPKNYVKFDDKKWRIIRINNDNSLKLLMVDEKLDKSVWDDRYNASKDNNYGINDFSVSRILEFLDKAYLENKYISKDNKRYLLKNDYCIGKLSLSNVSIDSLNLCNETYSSYLGLVQIDDVLIPSLDSNCTNIYDNDCTNYNYFSYNNTGWSLNASSEDSFNVFYGANGEVSYGKASNSKYVRPVIVVNGNVLYKSGDGSSEKPYVIGG